MRKILTGLVSAALLTTAAVVPAAHAAGGRTVAPIPALPLSPIPASATPAQRQQIKDIDDGIAWLDQLLSLSDGGDIMFIRPYQLGGDGDGAAPVRTLDLVALIKFQVMTRKLTREQGADLLISLSRFSGQYRLSMRSRRGELAAEREALIQSIRQAAARPKPRSVSPPPPPSPAAATCVAEGVWSNTITPGGTSTWVVSADGTARESGMGGAQGQAVMSGDTLTITWRTGAMAGVYTIEMLVDCSGGDGVVTFSDGPPDFDRSPRPSSFTRVSGPKPPA